MKIVWFFAVISAMSVSNQTFAKVDILDTYTRVYGSVQYEIPRLSGEAKIGGGGSFLLDADKRLWVTAFHVIPEELPAFKQSYMKIEGLPATFVCGDETADMAILQTDSIPQESEQAVLAEPVANELVYAIMGGSMSQFGNLVHTNKRYNALVTFADQSFAAEVVNIFEGLLYNGTGSADPSGYYFFSLDKALRTGFSGGPLINTKGEVTGIAKSINGGISYISSSRNVSKLLEKCADKL